MTDERLHSGQRQRRLCGREGPASWCAFHLHPNVNQHLSILVGEHSSTPSAVRIPAVVADGEIVRGQFGAFNLPMLVYAGVSAAL